MGSKLVYISNNNWKRSFHRAYM